MAQEVGYNDLTEVGANPLKHSQFSPDSRCEGGGGGLVSRIGCPPQTYPFELALMSVEGSELAIDGEVNVVLRLSNIGRESALVPWLTDPDQIDLPDDTGWFDIPQIDFRALFPRKAAVPLTLASLFICTGRRECQGASRRFVLENTARSGSGWFSTATMRSFISDP